MSKVAPTPTIEDEVLGNLRRLPLGAGGQLGRVGSVTDLNLPLEFLRRVADRVIQASFRERHRIVVGDVELVRPPAPDPGPLPDWLTIAEARAARAEGWAECRPAVRGYRAPILGGAEWPLDVPVGDPTLAAAAAVVTARLATDGLSKTLEAVRRDLGGTQDLATLRAVGIPTDLAGMETLSVPGFEAAAENGICSIGTIRVQLTGPGYYAGPGDGGSLDILRQLMSALPGVRFIASIEQRHVAGMLGHVRSWAPAVGAKLHIIPEVLPISQWAQDNTKAGRGVGAKTEGGMLLAPRWAGRGEEGGIFIPGETSLIDGLLVSGLRIAQSAILFEAGNLMLVREPSGRRVLLVGEAEVYRNTALGLARERVMEMFLEQFGAEICIVLPAASFHIDLEVSTRSSGGRVMAFVPDSLSAVKAICRLAASRMVEAGLMTPAAAATCAGGPLPVVLQVLGTTISRQAVGPGQFPLSFASAFRAGDVDSGVGNLHRILFALDWIAAEVTPPNRYPADRHFAAYLRSIRRAEGDRRALQRQLKGLGWEVVPVPAISAESVSLNPINGLHDDRRYLMPAYGGLFAPLDQEAAAVFARALGPEVNIVPVLTGETQRRGGGLHCAVCAIPAN